jgi:hypothetical protein
MVNDKPCVVHLIISLRKIFEESVLYKKIHIQRFQVRSFPEDPMDFRRMYGPSDAFCIPLS